MCQAAIARKLLDHYTAAMPKSKSGPSGPPIFVRGAPRELSLRLKAAAALLGYRSVNAYLLEHLKQHVEELERKGVLPKPK
jgi:hypothetical protein